MTGKSRKKTSVPAVPANTPASKLQITVVDSIISFTNQVADKKNQLWFRGHGMSNSYELLPSLYRRKKEYNGNELYELEFDMIQRFRERSTPFVGNRYQSEIRYDDLSILFYMQHYGIPTRLLDWTENPYVGLYFALNDANNWDREKKEYKENACVWVVDPEKWNNVAIELIPPVGIISVPNSDSLNAYLPKSESRPRLHRPPSPIGITGFHNSPRIVAQRGVFIVFGAENKTMDQFYFDAAYAKDSLYKIEIDKNAISTMRDALYRIGIADSVIYPDMDGFATEIARHFKL
jgi:hypothetical protein